MGRRERAKKPGSPEKEEGRLDHRRAKRANRAEIVDCWGITTFWSTSDGLYELDGRRRTVARVAEDRSTRGDHRELAGTRIDRRPRQ